MSNLRSVAKAIEHAGQGRVAVSVSGLAADIEAADRLVFPGQGALGECMRRLVARGLDAPLRAFIASGRPFLGICLGLQSLFEWSEENGGTAGLGLYAGEVLHFPAPLLDPATGGRLKVPHMGWNVVTPSRTHPLWQGLGPEERFYFVHSFHVRPAEPVLCLATSRHGIDFCAAAGRGNVFATQFHPEKSQRAGLALLARFLAWDGRD
jgi:glutamine amidotransferase